MMRSFRQHLPKFQTLNLRAKIYQPFSRRSLSTAVPDDEINPREKMYYDAVIVGAGPAGLSAAIKLKQLGVSHNREISVCVVEKGAEIGAHILSGNVFETTALDELFPDWSLDPDVPLKTKAQTDSFKILTSDKGYISVPHFLTPPELNNEGNYIISLSQLVRWLATKAEELGVEIYPGFSAAEVLYGDAGEVIGIATKDAGIGKDGVQKGSYTQGIELRARQTLFAEGARGSCSEEVIEKFNLRNGKDVQSYALGIKEVWQVPESVFKKGYIQHTLGWPLQSKLVGQDTFGGSFLYHMEPNLVLIGMVVGLDYQNPYVNPYKEFQRWKHHPTISEHIAGGECISYGARVLNEGGLHAIPKLSMPGGALIGCSSGFLNAVKIKGSHTAMKSGMLAAEALFEILDKGPQSNHSEESETDTPPVEISSYEVALKKSWIGEELYAVRNTHAAFHYGTLAGMLHTAFSCFISRGKEPWTLSNNTPDSQRTQPARLFKEIEYPKPDGVLSFDLLTSLSRSGTSHEHDQPSHLVVKSCSKHVPSDLSIVEYAGPEQRFCPAGVYEYTEADSSGKRGLVINAQNCVHCKCCSIKMPGEYIKWTVPEGGGGPAYTVM